MSSKKRKIPTICIKPTSLQILAQLDEALATGASISILPGSHFAQRIKLVLAEAQRNGLV